ncbi:MAG: glycoside hydrolase family 65 [Paenibacillus sp.]|nr:glycoside hydrolase family 65 [Paenibacillus sp.]
MNLRLSFIAICTLAVSTNVSAGERIDRKALVERNNPHVTAVDTLSSLTVGNGEFAFTVDPTGLQSFQKYYSNGVPLGTQSQWGWHSFPNTENYRHYETLKEYDFGHGHKELYSTQLKEPVRGKEACDWYRVNPHRMHLGVICFADLKPEMLSSVDQTLDMWNGVISSSYNVDGVPARVLTSCHPDRDMISVEVESSRHTPVSFRFPYPTGAHADDACDWSKDDMHSTEIVSMADGRAVLKHSLDSTYYYINVTWSGDVNTALAGYNEWVMTPLSDKWSFTAEFTPEMADRPAMTAGDVRNESSRYWDYFWRSGGVVDFSGCTDPRARELERRVVLSQYLLAVQCAGSTPPQETGLTYNSWFGKFHLEMIWWHQAQFPLYGHESLLARTLPWYKTALPIARQIAERQGFDGVRWMKMTDPSGIEAPSKVGSFLIWQQPHLIYLAELMHRAAPQSGITREYESMVDETAKFMASFATYDAPNNRYTLRGVIPAQETLRANETVNPPFELSYWHFGLLTANKWRERHGQPREARWDEIAGSLSRLASKDSLYLAAETAPQTYEDIRFTSDHMAVLGALGILPESPLLEHDIMNSTFDWIYDNWNWDKTWGWDYPTTAMCATRLGEPEKALNALLMDKRTNTYLPNGHNYQDARLRCYLPGNGGLLTAIALMTAGWDGCEERNPGFPKDGTWNVRWEGIKPLP